jgi:hypothetical protein
MQNCRIMAHFGAAQIILLPFAILFIILIGSTVVLAGSIDSLPPGEEPMLAEPGDWAAAFNEAAIACYKGAMAACDSIWLNERVLMETLLYRYGRTCGGRVDYRAIRREGASCIDVFPGYE